MRDFLIVFLAFLAAFLFGLILNDLAPILAGKIQVVLDAFAKWRRRD